MVTKEKHAFGDWKLYNWNIIHTPLLEDGFQMEITEHKKPSEMESMCDTCFINTPVIVMDDGRYISKCDSQRVLLFHNWKLFCWVQLVTKIIGTSLVESPNLAMYYRTRFDDSCFRRVSIYLIKECHPDVLCVVVGILSVYAFTCKVLCGWTVHPLCYQTIMEVLWMLTCSANVVK